MLNYAAVHTLATIIREKSFARAAKKLHLTQPAVSQRIRLLEDELGEAVLMREQPPRLTPQGARLVQHLQQVQQLERDFGVGAEARDESANSIAPPPLITIGVNGDSLGTWLLEALSPWVTSRNIRLELLVEDEDYSFELLRQGQVAGAISSHARALHGCTVEPLGIIEYLCVATRQFQRAHWQKGNDARQLATFPCVASSRKDDLQETFLTRKCACLNPELQPHFIASTAGYLEAVTRGWGWGLLPRRQADPLLKRKRLVELTPGRSIEVQLYWHQWRGTGTTNRELQAALLAGAKRALKGGSSAG